MPDNEDEMERLSRAIVEAILASDDVRASLEKLKGLDGNDAKSMLLFMLRLDSLSEFKDMRESAFDEMFEDALNEQQPMQRKRRRKRGEMVQISDVVDGRLISSSEKKFLEFLSDNFDQDRWLKDNGLSFD